jgi:alkylated DNA repair dioxygenase AlkB
LGELLNDFKIKPMNTPPITLINNWLDPSHAEQLFKELLTTINWQSETIKMFGKPVIVPRKIAWYGDDDITYRYSGITHTPLPWITLLSVLKHKLAAEHFLKFNSVLCNLYNDGMDYMGWHRDNEPELGHDPIIASVSLGEPRRFLFRHLISGEKHEMRLVPGSLLLMHKGCQRYWKHSLPKMINVKRPRINLTFRCVREGSVVKEG